MKLHKKAILPIGFKASGIASGIKRSGKLDLALFYSDLPAKASCQFTTNKIQAAPIKINRRLLRYNKDYRAIIVNSGNANCFTGLGGIRDAKEIIQEVADILAVKKESILVASTGIIGKRLPLLKIKKSLPELVGALSVNGISKAKIAIQTTDTFSKEATIKFNLGGKIVTICGVAKGAGMIAPNMRTMLVFILTDANITGGALNKALKDSVDNSFNCITVDGCMSTNDAVILLANGRSGNNLIGIDKSRTFFWALNRVCLVLARMIIEDAEGASKFIRIKINKAMNFKEARHIGLAIANSSLFKTAVYGENPNFGRIIAAIGASGIGVEEEDIKIKVSPLFKKYIDISVTINRGKKSALVYTSDLTPEYIRINAAYS